MASGFQEPGGFTGELWKAVLPRNRRSTREKPAPAEALTTSAFFPSNIYDRVRHRPKAEAERIERTGWRTPLEVPAPRTKQPRLQALGRCMPRRMLGGTVPG